MFTSKYNDSNPKDILRHANQLKGKTLNDYLKNVQVLINTNNKGALGNLIEKYFFSYEPNSRQEADFPKISLELKVSPLKKLKDNTLVAKERIVLSKINYNKIINETWLNNTLLNKLNFLLLMFYLHEENKNIDDYIFHLIDLWQPSVSDLKTIEQDWNTIVNKVKNGKAHEISEGDTYFLGACTKSATSKDVSSQPNNCISAKPRAFSLKQSYVNTIIKNLMGEQLKNISEEGNFDEIVLQKFNTLTGKSISKISKELDIKINREAKQFLSLFTSSVSKYFFSDELENMNEFKKSNLKVKCILLQNNGKPKEAMSFPNIQYKKIIEQEWDTSDIKEEFENQKYLWIIFKATQEYSKQKELLEEDIIFEKAMFWNMPATDLNNGMHDLWKDTVNKIKKGDYDNFMKSSDNPVGHIRPKGRNSEDKIDTPQGIKQKKMCFWLNTQYISDQISKNT